MSIIDAGLGYGFMTSLVADVVLNKAANSWKITKANDGNTAIDYSSFLSCDVRDESVIVDGPVEEGSFASYNKVSKPLELKISIAIMGDDALLSDSLSNIRTLSAGTDLLDVATPTAEYRDLNLESYNYTLKTENGRGVLYVDLSLKEVKQVKMQTTNVKLPSKKKRGKVQAEKEAVASMIGLTI